MRARAVADRPLLPAEEGRRTPRPTKYGQCSSARVPASSIANRNVAIRMPMIARSAFAEEDRGRFRADADVVVAIDHRVFGVVDRREQDVREEQEPAQRRQRSSSPPRTPSESTSRMRRRAHLRQMRDALAERIDRRERGADERQLDRQRVREQHEHEREREQRANSSNASRRVTRPAAIGRPRVRSTCASSHA